MKLITEYRDVDETTTTEQIDWNNINFLTAKIEDGALIIQRAPNVSKFSGIGVAIAYRGNFIRIFNERFNKAQEFIDQMPEQLLLDVGISLASGTAIPIPIGGGDK
jgi:hypothetical protein